MISVDDARAVRVLVVDDSTAFREAMRLLIEVTRGFEWIGDASCGEVGVEQAARLRPDLVLMDLRMPGMGGVEAARLIATGPMPATVILITAQELPVAPEAVAAEAMAKERLNPVSLRRLWERHGGAAGLT